MKKIFKYTGWLLFITFFLVNYVLFYYEAQKSDGSFPCIVTSVHDGDTFTCSSGTKIRIWAIDTPEVPPVVKKEEAKKSGAYLIRDHLSGKIMGKTLKCYDKGVSYKRTVAQCYLNNKDIAESLLQKGYAKELIRFSEGYYSDIR